ncbi:YciI family protein [Brachybacterium sp. AOP25-B2-12]|uniref:YciI family protein n=1 Tax=Brachybacterium sp. AOP25-B2-12 TaxID=3457710 RepID=UPI00403428A9
MSLFAVTYTYADDTARLDEHRPEHRAFLRGLHERGVLKASGPWADDGAPGALIIVQGESVEDVLAVFDEDPFRREGLVAGRVVRPWNLVIGAFAQE